ncbi:MAG: hypothetical protein R3F04_09025 [Lysobacteraceae bacterium]
MGSTHSLIAPRNKMIKINYRGSISKPAKNLNKKQDFKMSDFRQLQDKYRQLDNDALLNLWSREDRLPWAEDLLKRELINRGFEREDLDGYAALRSKIAQEERELREKEEIGTTMAPGVFFAGTLITVSTYLIFGEKPAIVAAIASATAYEFVMLRYVKHLIEIHQSLLNFATLKAIRTMVMVGALIIFGVSLIFGD